MSSIARERRAPKKYTTPNAAHVCRIKMENALKSPEGKVHIRLIPSNAVFEVRRDQIILDEWGRLNVVPGQFEYEFYHPYPHVYQIYADWLNKQELYVPSPNFAAPWTPHDMALAAYDGSPQYISTARKFLLAIYLGEALGALKFKDKVMNQFAMYFRPASALLPQLVREVYLMFASEEVKTMKKFLVDYHVWCRNVDGQRLGGLGFPEGSIPALMLFPEAFEEDLKEAEKALVPAKDRKLDRMVQFWGLWEWLKYSHQGWMRCRFHDHEGPGNYAGLCFDMII